MRYNSNKYYWFFIVSFWFIQFLPLAGQQTVKVATKTIKKEVEYKNQQIAVNGEKAKIFITKSPDKTIQINVRLLSKNPDENKAKKDLDIIKNQISENRENIAISNYFESDTHREITSNLSAIIEIKIPDGATVDITNIYGNVVMEDINCSSKIKNSFGEIKLNRCSGKFDLELYYINLKSESFNGELKCIAERTNFNFNDISGDFFFKTKYGSIELETNSKDFLLDVEAFRTEVLVELPNHKDFNFILDTKFSEIKVPQGLVYQTKSFLQNETIDMNKSINVTTSYCPITIKENRK